jgi:hypothetical protein
MQLHHRAVVRAWNKGDYFVRQMHDVGFKWGTKWQDNLEIAQLVARLEKTYDVVQVDTRDAG